MANLADVGADDGLPKLPFASPSEWQQWLEDNHAVSEGVWIKMAKKDAPIESVRYPEVLESALCFGWIDGRREALVGAHVGQVSHRNGVSLVQAVFGRSVVC
jgi:hypothetical protein